MDTTTNSIVSKVWSFCNTLRDDGVSYGDYLEQLTYPLFLKQAFEGKLVAQDEGEEVIEPVASTKLVGEDETPKMQYCQMKLLL